MVGSRKKVLVTGAGGALGSALTHLLAEQGDTPIVLDLHADRLRGLAGETGAVVVSSLGAAAAESPDGAALVAGGWAGGHPLHEAEDDAWRTMMDRNADSVHDALRALVPGMVARRRGAVVVVGSRNVERPWTGAGASAYTASKAAAVALAQAVAAEVLEHGVRVNVVLPSTMDTPANRAAMPGADASRWVTLRSAAEVIAFLLSDGARDVSGAVVPVYGRA